MLTFDWETWLQDVEPLQAVSDWEFSLKFVRSFMPCPDGYKKLKKKMEKRLRLITIHDVVASNGTRDAMWLVDVAAPNKVWLSIQDNMGYLAERVWKQLGLVERFGYPYQAVAERFSELQKAKAQKGVAEEYFAITLAQDLYYDMNLWRAYIALLSLGAPEDRLWGMVEAHFQ